MLLMKVKGEPWQSQIVLQHTKIKNLHSKYEKRNSTKVNQQRKDEMRNDQMLVGVHNIKH